MKKAKLYQDNKLIGEYELIEYTLKKTFNDVHLDYLGRGRLQVYGRQHIDIKLKMDKTFRFLCMMGEVSGIVERFKTTGKFVEIFEVMIDEKKINYLYPKSYDKDKNILELIN